MVAYRFSFLLLTALGAAPAPSAAVDQLDSRDLATEVAACNDLYQFANGGWLQRSPIPTDSARINRFTELQASVRGQRLALLQAILREPSDPLDAPIAALARSALDETALRSARETTLAALLPALDQLQQREQLPELLAAYQARGVPVLVRFSAGSREKTLRLEVQLLGLPDPAFYTRQDGPTREWLGRYRAYAETLLPLAGSVDATTDSAWAIDFESRIAAAASSMEPTETLSLRELERRFPNLKLREFLRAKELDHSKQVELVGGSQLMAAERLARELHPVQWRAWLRLRLLHLLAPYFDAPFRDAHERFVRRGLRGQALPASAEARALEVVEHWLGDAFAQRYIDTYFNAERQQAASGLIQALRDSLREAIAQQSLWQQPARDAALAKLEALEVDLRIPAERPSLSGLTLDAGTLPGNVLAINRWQPRRAGALTPGARQDALQAQLGYVREQNRLVASPALWQAPLFDPGAEPALRFGGIGALIGHELSHGFDLGGASFDAQGTPRTGWDEADRGAWIAATAPLIEQYAGYVALGEARLDGARLQPENLADLAGLQLAWRAFVAAQPDLDMPKQLALGPAQRFFVAWASLWRENASDDARRGELAHALQAPARFRAIGPLPHLPGFAAAFGCRADQPMLKAPARVALWTQTGAGS